MVIHIDLASYWAIRHVRLNILVSPCCSCPGVAMTSCEISLLVLDHPYNEQALPPPQPFQRTSCPPHDQGGLKNKSRHVFASSLRVRLRIRQKTPPTNSSSLPARALLNHGERGSETALGQCPALSVHGNSPALREI